MDKTRGTTTHMPRISPASHDDRRPRPPLTRRLRAQSVPRVTRCCPNLSIRQVAVPQQLINDASIGCVIEDSFGQVQQLPSPARLTAVHCSVAVFAIARLARACTFQQRAQNAAKHCGFKLVVIGLHEER